MMPTHPGSPAEGLPWEKVKIEQIIIEEHYAVCRNEFGKPRKVVLFMRAKGALPSEGETWLISRDLGYWTFACCIVPNIIEITGSNDGIPALVNLLNVLEAMGVIRNSTTDTRIRSTRTHTHVAPEGGGTTSNDSL